jgi:transcriptional regulator with XRE-family HTH domain
MRRTNQPEKLTKKRAMIAQKVSRFRKERNWTQAELSKKLGLSQARLSQIEGGAGSFTAEQFLTILELFNASVVDFGVGPVDHGADLQNSLARLGALHLNESSDQAPSERLSDVTDAVRETLLLADSPRQITALAPVLAVHADDIKLRALEARLTELGLHRRLGWVLENVVAAAEDETTGGLTRTWRTIYSRARVILGVHLSSMVARGAAKWSETDGAWDVLDRTVRSPQTLREVIGAASPISRRWGIATSLQTTDFARALKGARVD